MEAPALLGLMDKWLRNVSALIIGLAVGSICNLALIEVNAWFFAPSAPLESGSREAFNAYLRSLPDQAFILVVLAHLSQAFVGGWVAARLAASNPQRMALTIGIISFLGGAMALMLMDGPAWLAVELPLYLLVAVWAGRLEANRRLSIVRGD